MHVTKVLCKRRNCLFTHLQLVWITEILTGFSYPSKLTLAEEHVIALARLFIVIIKLTGYQHAKPQCGKLGHAIIFPQYSHRLEENMRERRGKQKLIKYPYLDDLYDTLNIDFVGSHFYNGPHLWLTSRKKYGIPFKFGTQ